MQSSNFHEIINNVLIVTIKIINFDCLKSKIFIYILLNEINQKNPHNSIHKLFHLIKPNTKRIEDDNHAGLDVPILWKNPLDNI